MSAPATKVVTSWQDPAGKRCTYQWYVPFTTDPTDAGIAAHITALKALSPLKMTGFNLEIQGAVPAGTVSSGPFGAEDKLRLEFKSSAGDRIIHEIPAPKETVFKSDHETLDLAASGVAAAIASFESNVTDPNGLAVTFVSGRRVFRSRSTRAAP